MGIIIKQSLKGSFWSYTGVAIGFVTTSYLFPRYLNTDVVGLFGLLIAYSTLFGQFSLLGIHGVTARLFPYFRDKKSGNHGFLFVALLFMIAGFSLFLIAYFLFSPYLIETNLEKSKLFANYISLLIPLTFFTMIFSFFDTYNKLLYDAVFGTFLLEFVQRLLILIVTLCFVLQFIGLNQLIVAYTIVVSSKGLSILLLVFRKGELSFRPQLDFITQKLRREILDVASFSIFGGIGTMLVFNIDKIVINQMMDLSNTGVYTIAFYFGTLVIIPSRPLLKISGTLVAEAWARDDTAQVKDIYYKSCINQFIIGGFLFLGIWANIDNILKILGPEYLQSKWVIFFIGLGYLIDMMTGANGHIIALSKYYRVNLYFILSLVLFAVGLLYFLIPIWGITGAAIAIAGALLLNNLMRYFFLLKKYRFQPFNCKFLIVALMLVSTYLVSSFIPEMNLVPDILIRSTFISLLFGSLVVGFHISEDINTTIKKILKSEKVKNIFKK